MKTRKGKEKEGFALIAPSPTEKMKTKQNSKTKQQDETKRNETNEPVVCLSPLRLLCSFVSLFSSVSFCVSSSCWDLLLSSFPYRGVSWTFLVILHFVLDVRSRPILTFPRNFRGPPSNNSALPIPLHHTLAPGVLGLGLRRSSAPTQRLGGPCSCLQGCIVRSMITLSWVSWGFLVLDTTASKDVNLWSFIRDPHSGSTRAGQREDLLISLIAVTSFVFSSFRA